mmetsp:Transcript_111522/g.221716  ORF Transcript_111522/g.221716 Transcript_111522/m.221716 type:complete len:271 (+) Transcript_111522:1831-2643(+)
MKPGSYFKASQSPFLLPTTTAPSTLWETTLAFMSGWALTFMACGYTTIHSNPLLDLGRLPLPLSMFAPGELVTTGIVDTFRSGSPCCASIMPNSFEEFSKVFSEGLISSGVFFFWPAARSWSRIATTSSVSPLFLCTRPETLPCKRLTLSKALGAISFRWQPPVWFSLEIHVQVLHLLWPAHKQQQCPGLAAGAGHRTRILPQYSMPFCIGPHVDGTSSINASPAWNAASRCMVNERHEHSAARNAKHPTAVSAQCTWQTRSIGNRNTRC